MTIFSWAFLAFQGIESIGASVLPSTPRAGEPVAIVLKHRQSVPEGCFGISGQRAVCIVGIPVDSRGLHAVDVGGEQVVVKLVPRKDRKGHVVFRVRTPKPSIAKGLADAGTAPVDGPVNGREAIRAATSVSAPKRLWSAPFEWPAEGGGHPFGVVRSYTRYRDGKLEKKWKGRHLGVDIGARRGSRVKATNDGRVILTGHFFGTGRCVYLDHGLGLFTMYFHLDAIDVKTGDTVKRGQTIGRVGSTGSSTAPHLHWEARIGRTSIDPTRLIPLSRKLAKLSKSPAHRGHSGFVTTGSVGARRLSRPNIPTVSR